MKVRDIIRRRKAKRAIVTTLVDAFVDSMSTWAAPFTQTQAPRKSRYTPHQGPRECARRVRNVARGLRG